MVKENPTDGPQPVYPSAPPAAETEPYQPPPAYQAVAAERETMAGAQPLVAQPTSTHNVHTTHTVVVTGPPKPIGNCNRCGMGDVHADYCTCCGVCWSILLFPFGLLCLCCCREKWCTNCGRR